MHATTYSYHSDAPIEHLVQAFETTTLPREEWTHHAHLIVALWYLIHFPEAQATEKIRSGIQAYNVACGMPNSPTSGYHETLTRFWIWAVRRFLLDKDATDALHVLTNALLESTFADRGLPLRYYSKTYLLSTTARLAWVEPDLKMLESIHEKKNMFEIQSNRLRLIPLDLKHLYLLKQNRALLEQELELNPSNWTVEPAVQKEIDEAMHFWIASVQANEANYPWFTNWEVVSKEENCTVGGIGFVGLPDASGTVIIGYGMDSRRRGQGFATESAARLLEWAFAQSVDGKSITQTVVAETRKDNPASVKVLVRNGFTLESEGEELLRWHLTREAFYHKILAKQTDVEEDQQ